MFQIRPVKIPQRLSDADAADFLNCVRCAHRVAVDTWGPDGPSTSAAESLAHFHAREYSVRSLFAAWLDGEIVGRGTFETERDPEAETAYIRIDVDANARRRGVASALLSALEDSARANGRRVLITDSEHPLHALNPNEELLAAPEGGHLVPARSPAAGFMRARGFTLAQVERVSVLEPGSASSPAGTSAGGSGALPGFDIVTWSGAAPDALVESYANARARMALDVPAAGLTIDEEQWSAGRVREHERQHRDSGAHLYVAVAVHEASGEIAAYTEIEVPPGDGATAYQNDTLVTSAYRGRGLGMRVKQANLDQVRSAHPIGLRLFTWNADENSHMIAINEPLGFVPVGYSAAWQKTLTDDANA